MPRKISFTEFVKRAKAKHGDLYEYDENSYTLITAKVKIHCSKHGWFEQIAKEHTLYGCYKCGREVSAKKQQLSEKEILESIKSVHGDLYSYSLSGYKNNMSKLEITCFVHGKFYQSVANHLRGAGCPSCGKISKGIKKRKPLEEVVSEFVQVHGNRYDYSKIEYTTNHTPLKIYCKVHKEFFFQSAANHYTGKGCPKCGTSRAAALITKDKDFVLQQFKAKHGDIYDYSLVDYRGNQEEVSILCKEHGEFRQTPYDHLTAFTPCPVCRSLETSTRQIKCCDEVVNRFKEVHGDTYDYSEVSYSRAKDVVKIKCPQHGEFFQVVYNHYAGKGCPVCAHQVSKAELELVDFLKENKVKVVHRDREVIKPKELDIYLPDHKIAIEYNGLVWHSEQFKKPAEGEKGNPARSHMIQKQRSCAAKGVRLIHINSDEKMDVVKHTLSRIIGLDDRKVFARKCEVSRIFDRDQIDKFFNAYHLQGTLWSKPFVYGLKFKGELVALMSFSKPTSHRGIKSGNDYELRRFASKIQVVGGASKLLKAFLREHPDCNSILSYSDNRWFTGDMYSKLGFEKEEELSPDYSYIKRDMKFPKNAFTHERMKKMKDFNYDPSLTERVNCINNDYYRIWDCGKIRWRLTIKNV